MSRLVEVALEMIGVRCTVEARGALAVLTPASGDRALERAEVRREALAILRAHGFTHAAVELVDDEPTTARDDPSA